jgi:hypothetical protein
VPRAILINGDVDSISCDNFEGIGAAWLISNTANTNLYQQCRSSGACIVEFNYVQADGTFADLLVSYLEGQNVQVATTNIMSVDTPTTTEVTDTQPNAPQYIVDPWMAKEAADLLNGLASGGGSGGGGVEIGGGGG